MRQIAKGKGGEGRGDYTQSRAEADGGHEADSRDVFKRLSVFLQKKKETRKEEEAIYKPKTL